MYLYKQENQYTLFCLDSIHVTVCTMGVGQCWGAGGTQKSEKPGCPRGTCIQLKELGPDTLKSEIAYIFL